VGGVVQAETAHRPDVFGGQGRQQQADVGDLVGHVVLAEDVALDDAGLAGLADVGDAAREDGIAVVGAAVAGQEADEALPAASVHESARVVPFLDLVCIQQNSPRRRTSFPHCGLSQQLTAAAKIETEELCMYEPLAICYLRSGQIKPMAEVVRSWIQRFLLIPLAQYMYLSCLRSGSSGGEPLNSSAHPLCQVFRISRVGREFS
jgi:hypothetical protein